MPETLPEVPLSTAIPLGTVIRTGNIARGNIPAATVMGTLRLTVTMAVIGLTGDILLGMFVPSPEVEEVPQMGMADGPMTIPHPATTKVTISREAGILHVEAQEALGMDVEARVTLQVEAPAATMGITVQATPMAEAPIEVMGITDRVTLQVEVPAVGTVTATGRSILQAIARAVLIPPVRAPGGIGTTRVARGRKKMRSRSLLCRSRLRTIEPGSERCFRRSS